MSYYENQTQKGHICFVIVPRNETLGLAPRVQESYAYVGEILKIADDSRVGDFSSTVFTIGVFSYLAHVGVLQCLLMGRVITSRSIGDWGRENQCVCVCVCVCVGLLRVHYLYTTTTVYVINNRKMGLMDIFCQINLRSFLNKSWKHKSNGTIHAPIYWLFI